MTSTVHWSLLNHAVRLQTSWYHKAFFQHSRAAWVRAECRGRQRPLSGVWDPELFIAWEQYTHFLGLQKKNTNHSDHSAWDGAKQVKPRAYAHTNTLPFTHKCMHEKKNEKKKKTLALCAQLYWKTHLSYGLKWVKIRTVGREICHSTSV